MKIIDGVKDSFRKIFSKVSAKFKKVKERRKQINQERIAEYEKKEKRYQEYRKGRAAKKYEKREMKRDKEVWVDNVPKSRTFHTVNDFEEYPEEYVPRKSHTDDKLQNYGRKVADTKPTAKPDQTPKLDQSGTNITIIINGENVSSVDVDSDSKDIPSAHYETKDFGNHKETSAKPGNTVKPASTVKPNSGDTDNVIRPKRNVTKPDSGEFSVHKETSAKPDSTAKPKETLNVKGNFVNTFEVSPMNLFGEDDE